MKKKQSWKDNYTNVIELPHLNYSIFYGVLKKEFTGRHEKSLAITENSNKNSATILFKKKPTDLEAGMVAHEIVHALQFMCRRRNIVMEDETEHMGYLMQFIFNEIYNRKYAT